VPTTPQVDPSVLIPWLMVGGYAVYQSIKRVRDYARKGKEAEALERTQEIDRATEPIRLSRDDAIKLAQIRGERIAELERELEDERERSKVAGRTIFEHEGRIDELSRRVEGLERRRGK